MQVAYAGILLSVVRTNDLGFEAVRSEDGMDFLYMRFRLDVSAVFNPRATSYVNSGGGIVATPGTLPTTTVRALRQALLAERGQLLVTDFDGQTMIDCPTEGEFPCDVEGGPFPKLCQITEVHGARTFLVRYVIEGALLECPGGDAFQRLILSNRWSEDHHINADFLTTRVVTGKTVFNRAMVEAGLVDNAIDNDANRTTILPPVEPGFQRMSVSIVKDSSGNNLLWRVEDQEQIYDLGETDPRLVGPDGFFGSGITRLSGSQGVDSVQAESGGPTAGCTMNSLHVRAYGSKLANQYTMIQALYGLALTMMDIGNQAAGVLHHASARRSLDHDEKWVELSLRFFQQPTDQAKIGGLRLDSLRTDVADLFRKRDGANPGLPNGGFGSATATMLAQALSYGGPCAPIPDATAGDGGQDYPLPQYGPPPAVNVQTIDVLPGYPPKYAPPSSDRMTTDYNAQMKYRYESGVIQAPNATGGQSQGGHTDPTTGSWVPDGTPTTSIFRLSQPLCELTVEGSAEALFSPPLLPSLNPTDTNLVLASAWVSPVFPVVINDALTVAYRVNFSYRYLLKAAFDPAKPNLAMGALPWTDIAFTDNYLGQDSYADGIANDPDGGSMTGDDSGTGSVSVGPDV